MGELIAPFTNGDMREEFSKDVFIQERVLEETFLLSAQTSKGRQQYDSDTQLTNISNYPCAEAQDSIECNDRLNGDYLSTYPDLNIEYNNECIRLYNI